MPNVKRGFTLLHMARVGRGFEETLIEVSQDADWLISAGRGLESVRPSGPDRLPSIRYVDSFSDAPREVARQAVHCLAAATASISYDDGDYARLFFGGAEGR